MITRYLTDITARFNPFSHSAKSARVFLSMINSDARNDIQIKTTVLSRTSKANPSLDIKFKDGKEMSINLKDMKINEIVDQVERHSRMLARAEDLAG